MSDEASFEKVVARVRERVDPSPEEVERLAAAVERLVDRTREATADLPVETDVRHVGSSSRGTWVRGDRDIDLFVRFPPELPREKLEAYGLRVGNVVLPDGHEEYAEHPYVTGEFEGFDVDLVPCYRVTSPAAIQSAVDRTPFHDAYVSERLTDDLASEVRLTKAFLKGVGAYGSDLRTRGFSGYLTELLVLEHGGFRAFLKATADWRPPVELDPADHAERAFDDPLVVVDPTDPERNVAAVVAASNVARVQHYARSFLAAPRADLFFPDSPVPLDAEAVREHLRRRDTRALAVRFDAPDVVDDQLYPQLRRSRRGLVGGLKRRGFEVLRSAAFADDTAVLLVELSVAALPAIERHEGPPVHAEAHATGFFEKYAGADDDRVYGPFIDGERYVVEREREVTTAREFVGEHLFDVTLGADVERVLETDGYETVTDEGVADLADEFGTELARYFDPEP